MSLIVNDLSTVSTSPPEACPDDSQSELDRLERYLAVIDNNKRSMTFVPNDALVALDMAGFAVGRLNSRRHCVPVSAARLALALVQPGHSAPVQ